MKKFFNKSVDERQEKELRIIESTAYWIMIWGLAITILIQVFIFKAHRSQIAGELIILTIGSIAELIGCARKGIWSYYSNPSWKSYFLTGVVLALAAAIIFGFMVQTENRFAFIVIGAVISFFVGFLFTAALGFIVNKKRKKLENEYDADL